MMKAHPPTGQRRPRFLPLLAGAAFLLTLACGSAGTRVVKVTEVEKDLFTGLKSDTVAKIEEIKKTISRTDAGTDSDITNLFGKTPSFDVLTYLEKFPESRKAGEDYVFTLTEAEGNELFAVSMGPAFEPEEQAKKNGIKADPKRILLIDIQDDVYFFGLGIQVHNK